MKTNKRGSRVLTDIKKYGFEQVTSIADATEDLIITVTSNDIRDGVPQDHTQCPAARSAKRCGKADAAIIAKRTAYLIFGTKAFRYRVPESLTREEIATDRGGSFHKGDYSLKAPRKGERLFDIPKTGKTRNHSNRKKRPYKVTMGVRTTFGGRAHIS